MKLRLRAEDSPAAVAVFDTGVRIESGVDAINCTIWLPHSEATKMAGFILTEQSLLEVALVRRRGRHES